MPRCWIGVVAASHAADAAGEGVCCLSHGGREAVAALTPGDTVALYAPRSGFRSGERVQAFVGIATIDGDTIWRRHWAEDDHESWVRSAAYQPDLAAAPIRPLLDKLSFIADARYWGIAFRKGLLEINANDLSVIRAAMADGH